MGLLHTPAVPANLSAIPQGATCEREDMEKLTADHPAIRGVDPVEANRMQLRDLFPEAYAEGKVNFDVLRQLLGDDVDTGEEKYGLNWHGKRAARRLALTPSVGTLRPCPDESLNWDSTRNLMIEGDNMEVLKLLQKSYYGKVKLIYIDPPYNTGNDYIYSDDYHDSIGHYKVVTGQVDGNGHKSTSNGESSGRFHAKWLNMMYPRLRIARDLLRKDGMIFISIDENENANLRAVCNEIFGEENFICEFVWKKKSGGGGDVGAVVVDHEYVLCYGRTTDPSIKNDPNADISTSYNKTEADGRRYQLDRLDKQTLGYQESLDFPITGPDGSIYTVVHKNPDHKVARWRWGKETVRQRYDELVFKYPYVYTKNYEKLDGAKPRSLLVDDRFGRTRTGKTDMKNLFDFDVMDFPKPVRLVKHLINVAAEDGDIILDFFAGSCPIGQAVLEMSREDMKLRFILVQLPERVSSETQTGKNALSIGCKTVADIGKERMRRALKRITSNGVDAADDLGFRVFKLDTTNIRAWDPDPDSLLESLDDAVEHLKANRSEDDILYEVILRLGLDLAAPISTREIAGKQVRIVGGGELVVCLATAIGKDEVDPLTLGIVEWRKDFAAEETMLVFRDSAFVDDVAKTNVTEILKQHGLGNVRSI